jgi:hypothetical protein
MFKKQTYIPHVEEESAIEETLSEAQGTIVAIANLPTIHANRIDVILESVTNDCEVTLRLYGAAQQAFIEVVLGTVVAGAKTGFKYDAFIGQTCSLLVENTDGQGTAANLVYTTWIGARA